MYYEIYIDVLFMINMVMDYLLLRLVNQLLKCSATHFQSLLGSLIGTAGMCLLILSPIRSRFLALLFMHGGITVLMIRVGCGCKTRKRLLQGVLTLYFTSFLLGGMLQVLLTYTQMGIWTKEVLLGENPAMVGIRTFLLLTLISYGMIIIGIQVYVYLKGKAAIIYEVTFYLNGRCEKVKGLYDTGNQLQDPITMKPVSVVEFTAIQGLLESKQEEELRRLINCETVECPSSFLHPHYIPYQCVGSEMGLLLAVTLDILCICIDDDNRLVVRPQVALVKNKLSQKKEFQMIINPAIIENLGGTPCN